MSPAALELRGVSVAYRQGPDWVDAVRDIDLRIEAGQTYGLVGESGSGKTSLVMAILQQLPRTGKLSAGSIYLGGRDVASMTALERRRMWHRGVKLVPQNPPPSLNPAHSIGWQLTEVMAPDGDARAVVRQAYALLERVGLLDPKRVAASFPHQLSGGMQQRVMIAMALGVEPQLLVLDEPTTNLDVTTEATILDLIKELIAERDTAVLFVSHSLGVLAQICDQVAVLYAGELVEDAPVSELYRQPLHAYTKACSIVCPELGRTRQR